MKTSIRMSIMASLASIANLPAAANPTHKANATAPNQYHRLLLGPTNTITRGLSSFFSGGEL